MSNKILPPYVPHYAGGNVPTSMGVEGTLGTADTGGTARALPFAVDPATGAIYVNSVGGQAGTNVNVVTGTINSITPGTGVTNLGKAGANTAGTTDVGIAALGIQTGTLGTAGSVGDGQYSPMRADPYGAAWTNMAYKLDSTNDSISVPKGTVTDGTLTLVSNLTNGTVRMAVGTLTTGTLQNLVSGTINALAAGTITGGTLQNLNAGTITRVENGSIVIIGFAQAQLGTVNNAGYTYSHFSAAGTTTIKSGTGVLHSLSINTKSVGGVGTLYESAGTSAAIIAAIDTTFGQDTLLYDISFGSLTFAWAGNTGGDITIGWR